MDSGGDRNFPITGEQECICPSGFKIIQTMDKSLHCHKTTSTWDPSSPTNSHSLLLPEENLIPTTTMKNTLTLLPNTLILLVKEERSFEVGSYVYVLNLPSSSPSTLEIILPTRFSLLHQQDIRGPDGKTESKGLEF